MRAEWQAHIDDLLKTYQEKRREIQKMQSRLETIEAEAEAADGLVKVMVDARGRLTGLELDPRVYRRLASEELSEAVLEAAKDAQAQVAEQMRSAMAGLAPEGAAQEGAGFDLAKLLPERPDDIESVRRHLGIQPR